jgi:Ca-activated chloride channel family protein
MRFSALVLMMVAMIPALAGADGLIVIHDPPPIHRPHYRFAPLEVRYHHVSVEIEDQTAVTSIDQVFYNPNRQRLEGTYIFPIPKGAQIEGFSMDIGGRQVEAELLDADKARRIYEDIVRRMKDPALLEYTGQGLLKARIYPIEPHSEKRVKMRYRQLLKSDSGVIEYLYPLNTEKFSSQPLRSVSVKVEVKSSKGLRSLYSPTHDIDITRHGSQRAVVGWEASNITPDTDFQLFMTPEAKWDVGVDLLAYNDGSDPGFFALFVSPSQQLADERVSDKDIVFVLDTSGSMAQGGKLDQAKKALTFCLANLNRGDHFEIIRFSTEAEPLFGSLRQATEDNRRQARQFVEGLKPIGGTAIEEALATAIATAGEGAGKGRPFTVVFLTDGRPTIGSTDEKTIISGVGKAIGERSIRVFCFGIGTDINTHLLDRITEQTRAVSQYVLPDEDIEVKVSSFFTKISHPLLANPRLVVSKRVRLTKMHPGQLPDLFKGDQLVVLGRYSGSGDVAISLEGMVNGKQRRYTYETRFPAKAADHQFIPRLWATRRVGFLLDQIRLHGDSAELREEVTALARRYGIVTPYTAYLIVEDEASRGLPITNRTLQSIDQDERMRAEAGRQYSEVNTVRSGKAAVGGAQALEALKQADGAAAPSAANRFARRGQGGAAAERIDQAIRAQQNRYLNGRTFYQNGAQWIDSAAQSRPGARRVQVRFGSDDYFKLTRKHGEAAQWFALGQNLIVLLDDTVYEIVE